MKYSISYAILTHNETDSLDKLLNFLIEHKDDDDEIVILDDYSDNEQTKEILDGYTSIYNIKYEQRHLLNDFAEQKNYLTRMCSCDYIMNIDADEIPHKNIMTNLKPILRLNPTVDMYWMPRVNTVEGITQEHINKWGWNIGHLNGMKHTKVLDTNSDEYELLKKYNLIIEEKDV